MRIHILDRAVIDVGDLCWDGFSQCGEVTAFDRTTPAEFAAHARDAETLVVVGITITQEMLDACPKLKLINLLSTGYDFIDVEAARKRGITVCNVSTYGTDSVAQFVYALLLELCCRVGVHDDAVRRGMWEERQTFSFWLHPLVELRDKTLGIVGLGRIGQTVAKIGAAFGMRVLAFDAYAQPGGGELPYELTTLEQVLAQADVLTLHCPLTEETQGMINRQTLGQMKRGAFLINAARGGLVVEEDLCAALESGQLGGAGLDVVASEPIRADSILLRAPNLILTPHIAWATQEARARMIELAVQNQIAFQSGAPINVVNGGPEPPA